jgi:hypothetical protein
MVNGDAVTLELAGFSRNSAAPGWTKVPIAMSNRVLHHETPRCGKRLLFVKKSENPTLA